MYGIPDFERQVEELPISELAPHLSNELGRIPWQTEKEQFMPKPMSKQKFVYKSDFLSDRVIEFQERVQIFNENLLCKFKATTKLYTETLNKLEDRLDDKNLIPTVGLGTLAGLISWKSNKTAPLPLKAIYSLSGVFLSTLITHERFRTALKNRFVSNLPEVVVNEYKFVDERVGKFGADLWDRGEDLFNGVKDEISRILTNKK